MTSRGRLRGGLVGLGLIVVVGTAGYVVLEGADPFDSLFMVMITISTVGFAEQFPLSRAGQAFTIFLMVGGVGLGLYTAGAVIEQAFVYGATRRRHRVIQRIKQMEDHVVLCGFGRVGRGTWESLRRRDRDVVVIESDPDRAEKASAMGVRVVEGDATDNTVLAQAGIEKAAALISCVTDDADNLVVVLSARSMVPGLHIVSRVSDTAWEPKLRMAGADRVVAPQAVGSERLAAMATEQTISDVFDVVVGGEGDRVHRGRGGGGHRQPGGRKEHPPVGNTGEYRSDDPGSGGPEPFGSGRTQPRPGPGGRSGVDRGGDGRPGGQGDQDGQTIRMSYPQRLLTSRWETG